MKQTTHKSVKLALYLAVVAAGGTSMLAWSQTTTSPSPADVHVTPGVTPGVGANGSPNKAETPSKTKSATPMHQDRLTNPANPSGADVRVTPGVTPGIDANGSPTISPARNTKPRGSDPEQGVSPADVHVTPGVTPGVDANGSPTPPGIEPSRRVSSKQKKARPSTVGTDAK